MPKKKTKGKTPSQTRNSKKKTPSQAHKQTPSQRRKHAKNSPSQAHKKNSQSRSVMPIGTKVPRGWYTTKQAASIMGCDPAHVRLLVRQTTLNGRKIEVLPNSYAWYIDPKSVTKYDKMEHGRGRPRGPSG